MKLSRILNIENEAIIDALNSSGIQKNTEQNELIIDVGEKMPGIPLVISGLLKVYRVREDQEIFLYHIEPGEICAMAINCCMSHKKSGVRIYSDVSSEIIYIPADKGQEWLNLYPEWSRFMLRSITDKFTKLTDHIDGLAFENLETRIIDYLSEKAEAYQSKFISITHSEMARDLNSSREVISRNLKSLHSKNFIKREGGMISLCD